VAATPGKLTENRSDAPLIAGGEPRLGTAREQFMKMLSGALYGVLLTIAFVSDGIADSSDELSLRPTLSASSSKKVYKALEPVILTLTLSLPGESEKVERSGDGRGFRRPGREGGVTVATFEAGTIDVDVAIRNGHFIEPTLTVVHFVDDPTVRQVASLTRIFPGERTIIPFDVPFQSDRGSELVVKQIVPESETLGFVYSLAKPGRYTLQFSYHYTGPTDGTHHVFRDKIRSNTISFLVR
jgi:hypothetical protein